MTTKLTKITTAIATGAVLLSSMAPMTFASTVVVSGNGDSSSNGVSLNNANSTTVNQTNTSNISNHIDSSASTGGNDASRNTGGNSSVDTGNATSNTSVTNQGNINSASVAGCGCDNGTGVLVSGNGVDTNNRVNVNSGNTTTLNQSNNTQLTNDVHSFAGTGDNSSSRNTGGSSSVTTGNATTNVNVQNQTNANVAQIGNGGAGAAQNSGDEVLITGNGDSSNNSVRLSDKGATVLNQTNVATIANHVGAVALTGGNDANRNTGGDSSVDTGNAKANVTINNEPNFNAGSIEDCGCTGDNLLKVAGNGVDSNNHIYADLGNSLTLNNVNVSNLTNDAYAKAKTGENDANRNTGAVSWIDPVTVSTGDATDNVTVNNSGNSNSFGPDMTMDLPWFGNVHFTNDYSGFMAAFMSFFSSHNG